MGFLYQITYDVQPAGNAGEFMLACKRCVHSLSTRHEDGKCDSTCDTPHPPHRAKVPGEFRPLDRNMHDTWVARESGRAAGGAQVSLNSIPKPEAKVLDQFRQWAERSVTLSIPHSTDPCGLLHRFHRYEVTEFYITARLFRQEPGQLVPEGESARAAIGQAITVARTHDAEADHQSTYCLCGTAGRPGGGDPGGRPRSGGGKAAKTSLLDLPTARRGRPHPQSQAFIVEGTGSVAVGHAVGAQDSSSVPGGLRRAASSFLAWPLGRGLVPLARRGAWARSLMPPDVWGAAALQEPRDDTSVSLTALGVSSGVAFRLDVRGGGDTPSLEVPDGLVVQALDDSLSGARAALAGRARQTESLTGYCLDFGKAVPRRGALYRVADQAMQRQFQPLRSVLQAGRRLAAAGRLRPDSDPQAYLDAIKQWAVWTRLERWDEQTFAEKFVERTRENARQAKTTWTDAMETQVRGAAPNRWRDVRAVLDEADVVARGPAGDAASHRRH